MIGGRRPGPLRAILTACSLTAIALPTLADTKRVQSTIVVNSAADGQDANPFDGVCETAPGNGVCTLRAAITEAQNLPLRDITFSSSFPNPTTFLLDLGTFIIDRPITITGNGAGNTIIDANGVATNMRAFYVKAGLSGGTVTISALTIRNGLSVLADGGGIYAEAGTDLHLSNVAVVNNSAGANNGGGIAIFGSATLDHCEITGNVAAFGGGIYGHGASLAVASSAIHDNSVGSSSSSGLWLEQTFGTLRDSTVALNGGGGVFLFGGDNLDVIDSTITGNTTSYAGGGILVQNFSNLHTYNATITGNTCGIGYIGGGVYVDSSANAFIANTILAQNRHLAGGHSSAPDDCGGVLTSLDYNLVQTTAGCSFTGPVSNNIYGKDPNVGPLQNNGGPTQTFALLAGSPAIDAGNPAGCTEEFGAMLTTDQRGFPRPVDGRCDIGSFEYGGPFARSLFTLPPCRVIDTRGATGPLGGPALAARATRDFVLVGTCGIPASARAVSVNVTVAAPTAAGDLRLFTGGSPLPLASTVNYRAAQTRANNAVVALGDSGDIDVRCDQATGTVQFILDVNGYFANPN
jgi:CSLREA domain-containing protein